ncbi:MAG: SIS domain-containing protein [Dehalococcoidia bacterium]|nr:SIS domain-containing protein [Dehalococcoidia bacterium]MSQ15976.1 SIS domain-containing protein [Dehalococcoidia bacterium]
MTQPPPPCQGHPYYMHDAILRQPQAVREMLHRHDAGVQELAATLASKRSVHLVGIGTSWHAALVGHHWFQQLAPGAPQAHAWHSFEFCAYPPPLGRDDAVIVISHRGTKTYSFQALELSKSRSAYTVAITATNAGPRIQEADVHLTTVEQERSAAFTVSYTAALTVLALLALSLGQRAGDSGMAQRLRKELNAAPGAMEQVLAGEQVIRQTAQRFQGSRRFISVGWGPNTASAYEVALKIKETSAVDSEGIQVEQLLHGPFCSVDAACLLTLIAPPGPGSGRAGDIAKAAAAAGAPVWGLVQQGDTQLAGLCTESFALSPLPEIWSPLLYLIPLQLFTYHLAIAKGAHPDLFQQNNPRQAAARRHYTL